MFDIKCSISIITTVTIWGSLGVLLTEVVGVAEKCLALVRQLVFKGH